MTRVSRPWAARFRRVIATFLLLGSTTVLQAADVAPEVARIKAKTDLPVIVGFGIRTPETSESIASVADGCVVGSAIVAAQAEGKPTEEVLAFVKSLADGAHRA